MTIEAQLFDGTILQFPDDTERSVIDSTVKKLTAERQPKEPKKEESSVLRQAADIPVNFTQGVVSGVRMISDAFGADNAISKNLRGVEEYLGDFLSAQAKADRAEMARIQKEAEDKGVWDQVKAGAQAIAVAPADVIANAFGTVIPTLLGGAIGVGARAATGIQALPKVAALATGATMGAGVGKGAIYNAVTEELKNQKLPADVIEKAATEAQEYGGKNLDMILANALLGAVSAGTGIEKALVPGLARNMTANIAKRGVLGRSVATGAPEFFTEGFQGGTEQATGNIALQREGVDVPTFRGVGTAATMEAIAGGLLGGGVGALSRQQGEPAPTVTPEDIRAQAATPVEAPLAPAAQPYQPPSEEDARQQAYEQQVARQDVFQSQFEPPAGETITPQQAYEQRMAQPEPEARLFGVTEQQPLLNEQELAARRQQAQAQVDLGLNVGTPRPPVTPQDVQARQLAVQQELDADRFKQQTIPPVVTPAQAVAPTPAPIPSARGIDRQAELLGQRAGLPQIEQVDLEARADIAGGTGQVAVPQTRFVDLTPMPPRAARQKLAALKADAPDADLNIVPHPEMSGRFAIEERVTPIEEAPEPRREDRPSVSYEQAVQMIRDVERTGVITPEAAAAAQQYNLNIDPALMNFAERTTPENLLVQQRRGMADEAALEAELRGGIATPEEAQRLRESGMGRPYDIVSAPEAETTTELGKSERQRRLEAEALAERDAAVREHFKTLQGPELWLEGFNLGLNPQSAIQTASPQFAEQFMKPEGRYSLVTTATPETKAAADKFLQTAMPMLKRFGLGNVGLRLVDSINGGAADGMYAQQVITLALESENPLGVMRHEVIHALKELGAFTPAEWKVLSKAAKDTWINQFFSAGLQQQYKDVYLAQNGDLKGFDAYLQEEAIAQAFRFYTETKPPAGRIGNIMRRLNEFFAALRNFLVGNGFQSVDDMFLPNRILADIERGAIQPGRAQGRKEEVPKFSMSMSPSRDVTPMDVQNIRIYNSQIESLVKKIGNRIAGMASDKTIADVKQAIKKLQSYTAQGLQGREWYERSAKAILDAFDGDPVLAEKLFQIIAITSANTEVAANFTKATKAWTQFANNKPIKVGTGNENKKIEALLYFGVDWDGRKTNSFYSNLMEAMEGKDSGRSTIDLHMTRMIFDKDAPTDAQYELAENMMRMLATKLDIPPRQVQAASWVTQKAKSMFEDYRAKGWKKKLNDEQLREFAFERAVTDYSHLMKAKVKTLPITAELREPSPEIRARTQTITGEVIPSVKTEMSQMEEMPFPAKDKFTKDVMRSNAVQNIAKEIGIESRVRVTVESGAYEGKVNPNLKVQLINPDPATAENDARDLAYAMSYVFKQDATPFFRADPKLIDQDQYGISLKFDKTLTPAVQKKLLGVMNQYLGADAGFSKIGPNEIVLINYRGEDGQPFLMSDPDFIVAIKNAREEINKFAPISASEAFGAKSEYPYHDWQNDASGNAIIERLYDSKGQRPDLQTRLDRIRESFISTARNAVEQSGQQPRFSLRYFPPESDKSALRPRDSGRAGISFNDRKEDAVTYLGSHYGKAQVETLNASAYGTGLRGAEARRLEQSDDDRIKRRVYFYIPRSNDTMPMREAGVGGYVYTQKLTNILAPGKTMSALYKQAGGDANTFESLIVDAGYDGYSSPDYGMMVVLNNDVPVEYEGTVDEVHGGSKTQPKFSLRAPATPEFKRFFGKSKITNPDGTPKVMYHGTARIIDEFIPKQAGAIFVTDNPEFAEIFTNESLQYMVREQLDSIETLFKDMSPKEQLDLMKKGYKLAVKEKFLSKKAVDQEIAELTDMVDQGMSLANEFHRVADSFAPSIERSLESGRNIMPLYVRAENPFDYENPDNIATLVQNLQEKDLASSVVLRHLEKGTWTLIERPEIQEAIKDSGFDGFYVQERGEKNLAVYNPNQIKSAIGNRGTYDETGRILFSLKNAPPNRYTKLASDDPTTGKAIVDAATSAFNAVRNDGTRTSARISLIDRFAGLSRTLESLPLFSDGQLRADMLHHAKAQGINLIKGGLLTGTPILNDDGTIGIERSENNLARAAHVADSINTNRNVLESGMSGRALIGEVARILRGADILAEDAELRKLGDQQIREAKRMSDELKDLVKQGVTSPKSVAEAQKAIDNMRRIGNANRKMNRELQVKPEDIAWAKKQLDLIPEIQEVLDIWKNVNTSLVNLWEDTGLLDKETADRYRAAKNYVPLFKSREDLNEESFFRTGSGTKTTAKIKRLEGADISRNIWENVDKQYATMIAAAYENQTRRASVEQMRGIDPELAEITNASDPRVNLRYRDGGKDVHVVIENPNDLAAFQSMSYQLSPIMKFLGGFTNVLRAGALLNPMFWIRQLIRDPIHATIAGQSGVVTPVHSAAEFLRIITKNSEEARILASRGVIGQFDSTVTLSEFLGEVGKDKQKSPGFVQRGLHKLMQIHEASDAATRVAIFKKAKDKAIKDGMSEAQAIDYAVFKARESINFALTGNSPTLANARQMIPFLNATIVGLDTLYRAATGYGLNAEEKAQARRMFRNRAMMMVAMSFAYAMSLQDDEDYKKLPDYVKDGNWLVPMSTGEGKTFVKVSVPYEVGFLFKTLPELFVRYLSGTSTGKETLAAFRTGLIHNMPTGGVPIPQFAKPALEVVTNYSFFNNRPIEGMGDSRLPVAQRGQKASEFSKMMSSLGLDEVGLSPAKIDTLTKGYFAEFGAFFNELTDALIITGSGGSKTPRNIENLPFMKAFLTDPQVNKAIGDFYQIEKSATETANQFTKYKNEGQGELLQQMMGDQEIVKQVGSAPVLRQISRGMSDIQKAIRIIDANKNMPPEERREKINELQKQLGTLAERGKKVADTIGLSR